MTGKPPPFVGFEEPNHTLDDYSWHNRIRALAKGHLDKWAKYGPYNSKKSAQRTASSIQVWFTTKSELNKEYDLLHHVEYDGDKWYLFLRLSRKVHGKYDK